MTEKEFEQIKALAKSFQDAGKAINEAAKAIDRLSDVIEEFPKELLEKLSKEYENN